MAAQMRHLAAVAGLPHVTIQVMPGHRSRRACWAGSP